MTSPTNANHRTPRRTATVGPFFVLDKTQEKLYNYVVYEGERTHNKKHVCVHGGEKTHNKKSYVRENLIFAMNERGKTPMTKNVHVLSSDGKMIGVTYPKRAMGLVKKGRARYLNGDESVIVLVAPPVLNTSQEDEMNNNFNFDEFIEKTIAAAKSAGDTFCFATGKVADKTEETLDRAIARMSDSMREYLERKQAEKDAEVEKIESIIDGQDELEDYIDELEDSFDELEDDLDDLSDELDELQDELEELDDFDDDEEADEDVSESRREEIRQKLEEVAERIKSKIGEYEAARKGKELFERYTAKMTGYAEEIANKAKESYEEHMREFEARRAEKWTEAETEAIAKAKEAQTAYETVRNANSDSTEALISQVVDQLATLGADDGMAHQTLSNLLDGLMAERREKAAKKATSNELDDTIEHLINELGRPDLTGAAQGAYRETLDRLIARKIAEENFARKKQEESFEEARKESELEKKVKLLNQAVKSIKETEDSALIEFFAAKAKKLADEGALDADMEFALMQLVAAEKNPQKRNAYMEIIR